MTTTTVSLLFVKVPAGQYRPVFVQGHPVRLAVSWYRPLDARSTTTGKPDASRQQRDLPREGRFVYSCVKKSTHRYTLPFAPKCRLFATLLSHEERKSV